MGVAYYFSYIVKNHASIIRKLSSNPIKVDNLYLDCNSIIYDAVYKLKLTDNMSEKIISEVILTIEKYINELKPSSNVFIAFDGVAPQAKLEQQRSRRFKSLYQNSITRNILNGTEPDPWNTTAITPGTYFMLTLNDKINQHFSQPSKFNLSKLIVSTSSEVGEGEHKLFQYIRDNSFEHKDKNTVIYGLDADLIMLCINHLPLAPNLYLFRETPQFIKSINSELDPNESYILDIPELANTITIDMNNGNELIKVNRIYDYIFICFFLGNDFMPHFPALNIRTGGIDKMLQAYKATIGTTNEILTNGKTIYWKNVRKLVKFLADNEEEFFKQEHKIRDKREKHILPDNTPQDKLKNFISIPSYQRTTEKYINPYKQNWQFRYYKSLFELNIDQERRKQICTNYLQAIEWNMKYYTVGCPDWRWCYNYNYPPLLQDLIHFIPYFETEFIENKPQNPVSELVQLCYVMPKQSLLFLPEKLFKALISHKSDWYQTVCDFSWSYCKYFWEAHPNLPHIDIYEIETFVEKYK